MLYYIGSSLELYFGPARLFSSYTVLITIALFAGFLITKIFLPKFYVFLPHDRGREFTLNKEISKGKPTGSGSIFITFFVLLSILLAPMNALQLSMVFLTWVTMLTGFLDDRSVNSWGEYRKGLLDLIISVSAAFLLYYLLVKKMAAQSGFRSLLSL